VRQMVRLQGSIYALKSFAIARERSMKEKNHGEPRLHERFLRWHVLSTVA